MPLKVLSWNVHCIRGAGKRLSRIAQAIGAEQPDIVLLQEVAARWEVPDRLQRDLAAQGLTSFFYSGDATSPRKRYGNVIASRWPVTGTAHGWASGAPFPQLLAKATVEAPAGPLEALSVHIPNGSGNGWKKVYTLESLAAYLSTAPRGPRIVAGDFNEPRWFEPDGTAVSFGQRVRDGVASRDGLKTRKGETHPRVRWDDAVRALLGPTELDLRHAFGGERAFQVTHVVRGRERYFDHLLVSGGLDVVEAGYLHQWRNGGLSDHSGVWGVVEGAG